MERTASEEVIKTSYRKRSLAVHPDRTQGVAGSHEAQQRVNQAWDVLRELRREYDAELHEAPPAAAGAGGRGGGFAAGGAANGHWEAGYEEEDAEFANMVACGNCGGTHGMKIVRWAWAVGGGSWM